MPDILCLGEPMLEFNQQLDGRYLSGHGGDVSNAAICAARSGASVGMITRIGADAFGDSFVDLWTGEGISTDTVAVDPVAPTGIYFVTHGPDGHRFSYYRKGSAASRMVPDDLSVETIRKARILHVSGISQGISDTAADTVFAAIAMAREAGVQVSYDTNLRPALWPLDRARAVIHAAMRSVDIALPGLDDAALLTGLTEPEAIADYYLSLGAAVVALTLGADGTLVATPTERRTVPAFPVKAVDATGAGDCFDGAFLARLVSGDDAFAAARWANAAAALAVQGYGAVAPLPTLDAVEAFIASR